MGSVAVFVGGVSWVKGQNVGLKSGARCSLVLRVGV